jgi:hypothetical protein
MKISNDDTKWMNSLNKDFEPVPQPAVTHSSIPPANISDRRAAHAAEYSAYQLGQISKKLDLLIEAIEKLASKS